MVVDLDFFLELSVVFKFNSSEQGVLLIFFIQNETIDQACRIKNAFHSPKNFHLKEKFLHVNNHSLKIFVTNFKLTKIKPRTQWVE